MDIYIWMEIVGCIAGFLTSFAFFAQLVKLLRVQKSLGISIPAYSCALFGCCLWLFYGVFLESVSLVIFSFLNIVTTSIIIFLTYRYRGLT